MLIGNNSNNWSFAKAAGGVLRPGLHPPDEEEESFWVCAGEISDPVHKGGAHPTWEDDHNKPGFV